MSVGIHWIFFRMQVQKNCFEATTQGQLEAKKDLQKLLSLNPKAYKLKLQKLQYELQLVEALTGLPYTAALVAQLRLLLRQIHLQQLQLDTEQKQLLLSGRLKLNRASQQAVINMNKDFKTYKIARDWLQMSAIAQTHFSPGLAVMPQSSDLAPSYRLQNEFEQKQALIIFWKAHLRVKQPLNNFIKNSIDWEQKCTTTLSPESMDFRIKIREDKSFSKLSSP